MSSSEMERLAALRAYEILDTAPEAAFDRITALASDIFDAPMCAVSLIDTERQWFKARVGLEDTETPRSVSFCDHAIRADEVMVVPDATADARFAENPLVTGELGIRFYAGAPLRTKAGINLGALCVIDKKARPDLTPNEKQRLATLAQVVVDELELRMVARQLTEAKRAAEEAARAKADFLATMTHELRSPLTSIIGFSGMLNASGGLAERDRHFAQRIQFASSGLLGLVNDVLDLSKLEAGAVQILPQQVELRPLLRDVLSLFVLQAENKHIGLDLDVAAGVPAKIETDPSWLQQILTNLLSNAVKFTDKGGVSLAVEPDGETVFFHVKDTGPGIPPERLDSVFGRYEQADRTVARQFGGTGLGLTISKGLAEAMGGHLAVTSKVGEGSCFTLTIPAAPKAG